MKDSVIYQEILEEGIERGIEKGRERGREEGRTEGIARGRVGEARSMLIRLGSKKLGVPDAAIQSQLERIADAETLEELTERLLDTPAASWTDLLRSME